MKVADTVISPLLKRVGLLAVAAAALGACDLGLVLDPDPADAGDTVTVSNSDGPHCIVEEGEDGVAVDIILVTDLVSLMGPGDLDIVASVMTGEDGLFEATVEAPDRPGQHLLFAVCGGVPDEVLEEGLGAADVEDPVDEDGIIVDSLRVSQAPLTVSVDDDEVNPGDEVTATFNRCQDENDFGILEGLGSPVAVDTDDPTLDFPDLEVYLDGELVETIAGDERYPTGTVDVKMALNELGEHEIEGVCTFQTFDLDLEWLLDEMGEGLPQVVPQGTVGTAAIDYPLVEGPITLDETTTIAVTSVSVVAVAVAPTDTGTAPTPVAAAPPTRAERPAPSAGGAGAGPRTRHRRPAPPRRRRPRSDDSATTMPSSGAPTPWERSKKSEKVPTAWLRSWSGTSSSAAENRAG